MSRLRKRRRQPGRSSAGPSPLVSTYQARIAVYEGRDRADGDAGLSAYGELYGKVQRKLFADVAAGWSAVLLKREYIKEHGIPARMFNAVWVSLDGKVRRCGRRRGCGWTAWNGELLKRNGRLLLPKNKAGGSRFTRSGGGWAI